MGFVRKAVADLASKPTADTNARQWLDAYVDGESGEAIGDVLAGHFREKCTFQCPVGYVEFLSRWEDRVRTFGGPFEKGRTLVKTGRVVGRMVVGIGHASTRETNLHLDRTFGVPVIPGSALKGIAAAAAHQLGGGWWKGTGKPGDAKGEDHALLFGGAAGTEGEAQDQAGTVIFHDAWWIPDGPTAPLPIHLDVMTVHHQAYYAGKKVGPMDWDEPNPVSFLSASGNYLIAVTGPEDWAEVALELLRAGLSELGVGAKTRSGYGRLQLEDRKSDGDKIVDKFQEKLKDAEKPNLQSAVLDYLAQLAEVWEAKAGEFADALVAHKRKRERWEKVVSEQPDRAGVVQIRAALERRVAREEAERAKAASTKRQVIGTARKVGKKLVVETGSGIFKGKFRQLKGSALGLGNPNATIEVEATIDDSKDPPSLVEVKPR